MKKQEIEHIKTLIVEKINIHIENFIIHKNLFLLTLYIIFITEMIDLFSQYIWIVFIIAFIILPYIILGINIILLKQKLNEKIEFKLKSPFALISEINKKSKQLLKSNINSKYIIKNIGVLFNELKEEKNKRENKNISFLNIFKVITVPSILALLDLYNKDKISFFIKAVIMVIISLVIFINDYVGDMNNDIELSILDEIEEYLNEYEVVKNICNLNVEIENQLEEEKEIDYEEASKGLTKNWKEAQDQTIKNKFSEENIKFIKKLKIEEDVKKTLGNVEYKVISKTIKLQNLTKNEEKKEIIFAVKDEYKWKIIDTEEKKRNYFEKDRQMVFEKLKKPFWILLFISIIVFIVMPYIWIDSKLKMKKYILNNPTNEDIVIITDSEKIKIPKNSNVKKNLEKFDIKFESGKKCELSFDSNKNERIINFTKNECFFQDELEIFEKKRNYILVNSTNNDIEITSDKNHYKLKSKYSIVLQLENGNYKLAEGCDLEVKDDSSGQLIKIKKENDKQKCDTINY